MTTRVLMIADKSGSMQGLAADVRGGHNAYLDQLTAEGADVRLTVVLFDTNVTVLDEDVTPANATRLTAENYLPQPQGGTALLDAVGTSMQRFAAGGSWSQNVLVPGDGIDDKVLVFIQTDGEENSSRRFTLANIKALVADAETKHKWAFVFSGTAPEAWTGGASIGLAHSTVNRGATRGATYANYAGYGAATRYATANAGPLRSETASGLVQEEIDKEEKDSGK